MRSASPRKQHQEPIKTFNTNQQLLTAIVIVNYTNEKHISSKVMETSLKL
jgi:hypothetical protein